jgi:FMN phosphatase YigB (HAD superfamily)
MPGARQTLNFLSKKDDELFLLTAGDPKIQEKKLEFYNLQKWFGDKIFIVPHHKKEKLVEIVSKKNPNNTWFVGNSARSDIAPSLEIGIGAIHIPQDTWAYDKHELDNVDKTRLITIKEIGEIPRIY